MLTEQLMKKRFKVIADWPGNVFEVGDILQWDDTLCQPLTNDYIKNKWCEQYPHLFKELAWWEDRKPEDMPEYVKYIPKETYHKIEFAQLIAGEMWLKFSDFDHRTKAFYTDPATEQEYLSYKKQKV